MRRILLSALICLPGCFIPFAAPSLSHVPAFDLGCDPSEVHAFRANITEHWADIRIHHKGERCCAGRDGRCTLKEIRLNSHKTPGQAGVGCTRGFYLVGIALNYPIVTSETVAVRLYRPGFETVQLDPGDSPDRIPWKAAATNADQEKAIDDLFELWSDEKGIVTTHLEPRARSSAHRAALRFGSTEYARLAKQVADQDPVLRDRLVDKARRLEKLADVNVTPRAHAGP